MKIVGKIWVLAVCLLAAICQAQTPNSEEPDWFEEDPEAIFNAINEGHLQFLQRPPEKPVHHHHNTLIVTRDSIRNGWVGLVQCHDHLDQFPSAQIVYHRSRVRNLRLTSHRNIGVARVEGSSVQLKNIGADASLCVEAESQALRVQADGTFLMKNGPFMRKFLDGYFPMRVSMFIRLPAELEFVDIEPPPQRGFTLRQQEKALHLDAWFEGKLVTRIRLRPKAVAP